MTDKQLLEQALEALEEAVLDYSMGKGAVARHMKAITAIKQALAAPVQRMVANMRLEDGCIYFAARILADGTYDLYTTPPAQRTFAGLTDEEIKDVAASCMWWVREQDILDDAIEFARAYEAKLRSKNEHL